MLATQCQKLNIGRGKNKASQNELGWNGCVFTKACGLHSHTTSPELRCFALCSVLAPLPLPFYWVLLAVLCFGLLFCLAVCLLLGVISLPLGLEEATNGTFKITEE